MNRIKTGILIFADVEVLDFCGPFEVFSVTRLDPAKRREEPSPFDVFLVAEKSGQVTTTGGMQVTPAHSLDTCPQLDLLVVPGGWGTRQEVTNRRVIDWITRQAIEAKLVTSVCTGSFLLGSAGLLRGRAVTTHWMSLERMRLTFPGVKVDTESHWVEDGNIFTSAGISAGIDVALRVVSRLFGEAVGQETARYMEYPYPTDAKRRVKV
jgi:transcriptional regulator GlxA family with amidase domain